MQRFYFFLLRQVIFVQSGLLPGLVEMTTDPSQAVPIMVSYKETSCTVGAA